MKLWTVTLEIETMVVAETEREARRIAHENCYDNITDCDEYDYSATPYRGYLPGGWDLDSSPYAARGAGGVEYLTIQEWIDRIKEQDKIDADTAEQKRGPLFTEQQP